MPQLAWWKIFIVVASYVFYGTANWKFCFLLGGVTLGNYLFARLIAGAPTQRRKKQFLAAIVALDLATLGVFKYYAFFVEDVDRALNSIALGDPAAAAHDRAAGRDQLLHLPGDHVRRRHLPRPRRSRAAARRRGVPQLLLAPGRRADRARVGVPAADQPAARPGQRGGRRRPLPDRRRPGEEGGDRRLPRARGGRPGLRRPRGARGARRDLRLVRVRRADLLRLLRLHGHGDRARAAARGSSSRRTSTARTARAASASSGGAGTSRCRASCATTCTSRSAATAAGGCARRAT